MPELPEVETVRRGLLPKCLGRRISKARISLPKLIHHPKGDDLAFEVGLVDAIIRDLTRRGKYLVFHLSESRWLVVHLGMTGKLAVFPAKEATAPHVHARFLLDNGLELRYQDVRQFGSLSYWETNPDLSLPLSRLGPEPFDPSLTPDLLYQRIRGHRVAIKTLLLNQQVVAGLGNIYVDEVLFASGIRPRKSSHRITRRESDRLLSSMRHILSEAIAAGGSTVRDYRDANGQAGQFQLTHQVYGRGGAPCKRCGSPLRRIVLGGRSTVYCATCQKS